MKRFSQLSSTWKLSGILVIFSVIVLGNITRWSIWFDEAFTAYIVRFNFAEIYRYTSLDLHPPLYYWAAKLWTVAFGTTELTFRSLSLVFAIVGLIGLYKLTKKLFNEKTGLIVTAAVSLSPMLIRFSEEARMYTMVFAIVMWATYLLVLQTRDKPKTWRWVAYGVLISAGMWVHYYAALAWLAHWVWRYVELRIKSKKHAFKRLFTKDWVLTYSLAVGLYLPWLPYAVTQFATLQGGFWIPRFGAYTPVDYVSNGWMYQEYGRLVDWQAVLFIATVIAIGVVAMKARKHIPRKDKQGIRLFVVMALAPPLILMLLSLPPLKPSFIDRYVLTSLVFLIGFVVLLIGYLPRRKNRLPLMASSLVALTLVVGIFNVYYYGNYNKNSWTSIRVREVTELVDKQGVFGQPIITDNWLIYYEASFYDSREHRVYFIDDKIDYGIGATKMLEENNAGKIKNLTEFATRNPRVWFLTSAGDEVDVEPPVQSWKKVRGVEAYDYIDEGAKYRAILYDTTDK